VGKEIESIMPTEDDIHWLYYQLESSSLRGIPWLWKSSRGLRISTNNTKHNCITLQQQPRSLQILVSNQKWRQIHLQRQIKMKYPTIQTLLCKNSSMPQHPKSTDLLKLSSQLQYKKFHYMEKTIALYKSSTHGYSSIK